jgi:uncharacterized protein
MKLIVFGRVPLLGAVKTRLAAQFGDRGALAIYRELLQHCLAQFAEASDLSRELCLAGVDTAGECLRLGERYRFSLTEQSDGDLGERMRAAFERGLWEHDRVVLIGSDCPVLDLPRIRWAFTALRDHDAVFTPTEDGGYSLIGLRRAIDSLFEDVRWSSDSVMQTSRERLQNAGLNWAESPTLWDIDEPGDWLRWQAQRPKL